MRSAKKPWISGTTVLPTIPMQKDTGPLPGVFPQNVIQAGDKSPHEEKRGQYCHCIGVVVFVGHV